MKALFKLVLRGSLVGAIAMATATGCGDDADDGDGNGGEGNSGGSAAGTSGAAGDDSTDGGTSPGNGGTDAQGGQGGQTTGVGGSGAGEGGATTDTGGAGSDPFGGAANGGAVNEYMGPSIAKFCNTLVFDEGGEGGAPGQPTTMRLEIGVGNDKVTFTAATDECVPADGEACTEIPSGQAVLVNLFDVDDDTVPIDFATANIAENDQLIFYTDIDNNAPIWNFRGLNPGFACEDVTYDDVLAIE
jgi:hypothetical protein